MTDTEFVDYYELLGISVSADKQQIREAFMHQAKLHHPDVGGSTAMMQRLNTAYKTLISQSAKASYDMLHSFHVGTTQASDYSYSEGRQVNGLDDMSDDEIEDFLNTVLEEYSYERRRSKRNIIQRVKSRFAF